MDWRTETEILSLDTVCFYQSLCVSSYTKKHHFEEVFTIVLVLFKLLEAQWLGWVVLKEFISGLAYFLVWKNVHSNCHFCTMTLGKGCSGSIGWIIHSVQKEGCISWKHLMEPSKWDRLVTPLWRMQFKRRLWVMGPLNWDTACYSVTGSVWRKEKENDRKVECVN